MEFNQIFTTTEKVNFIKHMFKHYQPTLTIPEQITLLTLWEESCVIREEYEMAQAIKDEMDNILNNPNEVPQKNLPIKEEIFYKVKKEKKTLLQKFSFWVKNLFNPKPKI